MNLRKPPLSMHTVVGGNFVVRARDMKPVRISELAHTHSANHIHRLLTPAGEREVCIQIGQFQTKGVALRFRDSSGKPHSFVTNLDVIRLDAISGIKPESGCIFNALHVVRGEQQFEHLTFEKVVNMTVEHYVYTMTPGPIYLGAGKRPLFLPFEVT